VTPPASPVSEVDVWLGVLVLVDECCGTWSSSSELVNARCDTWPASLPDPIEIEVTVVMFHIILTSETLLMSQRPLLYTAAAFSVTTADFSVQIPLPPLPSLSFAAVIIVTTAALSVTAADFTAQCRYRHCRLCRLPPSFPLPLLPSPSLPLPPLPAPPPTDVHIWSTRSGNGLTIRRHRVRDG
jgi:hypothetical protein